jgi:hypothetical protein
MQAQTLHTITTTTIITRLHKQIKNNIRTGLGTHLIRLHAATYLLYTDTTTCLLVDRWLPMV